MIRWSVGYGSLNFGLITRQESTVAHSNPAYVATTRANDIGIIVLPSALIIGANINFVSLPAAMQPTNLPFLNEEGTVDGFGWIDASWQRPTFLQRSFQRVVSNEECTASFFVTIPQHFCARDLLGSTNPCNGDLGNGLITRIRGTDTVVGVLSMTTHQCASTNPSAYTRVAEYTTWIQSITNPTQ